MLIPRQLIDKSEGFREKGFKKSFQGKKKEKPFDVNSEDGWSWWRTGRNARTPPAASPVGAACVAAGRLSPLPAKHGHAGGAEHPPVT